MMDAYKRRQFLIDKKFQLAFIFKFCSLLLIGAIFTVAMLYVLSSASTSVFFAHSRIVVENTAEHILPLLLQTTVIVTVTIGIVAALLLLFSSHKISGPLFRLKREVEKLTTGQIPKDFHIRNKDQLQGIATSFDNMVKELNLVISDLKNSWEELKKDFSEIAKEPSEKNKQIIDKINLIDEKIQHFKT